MSKPTETRTDVFNRLLEQYRHLKLQSIRYEQGFATLTDYSMVLGCSNNFLRDYKDAAYFAHELEDCNEE